MKAIKFYKVIDAECDFCGALKSVVTQANETYICRKCACEINKHARVNERVVINQLKQQNNEK